MKTTMLYKAAATLALGFTFFTGAKAQVTNPYPIQNNSGCLVTINWQAVNPACSSVCASMTGVVISTGANSISFPGVCGSSPCDFKVQVTMLGTNPISPSVNVSASGGGTTTIPSTASCPGNHSITMAMTGANIN